MKRDIRNILYHGIIILVYGLIGILAYFIVTPEFVAKYLSSDHHLTIKSYSLIKNLRYIILFCSILFLAVSIILILFKKNIYHSKLGRYVNHNQYKIPIFFVVVAIISSRTIFNINTFQEWFATHWLFTYKYGFIKRGLVGAINNFIFGELYGKKFFIQLFSFLIFLFLIWLLLMYTWRVIKNSCNWKASLPIIIFFSSSATVSYFASKMGRFDQLNYLLTLIILTFLIQYPSLILYFIIGIICAIAMLVHEAFLLINFPMIIALGVLTIYYRRLSYRQMIKLISSISLPVLLSFIFVLIFGKQESISFYSFFHKLSLSSEFTPHDDSVMVLYRSFQYNLSKTLPYLSSVEGLKVLISSLVGFIPSLVILFFIWKEIFHKFKNKINALILRFVLISNLSIVVLYFVAVDYGRWTALLILNLFICAFYFAIVLKDCSYLELRNYKWICFVFISFIYSTWLGTLHDVRGFSKMRHIFELLF